MKARCDKIFSKGDLVHVADDLGPSMRHFTADVDAIVLHSYGEEYGRGCATINDSYALHLKGRGFSAWYHPSQLTLLESNRGDLLAQWKADAEAEAKRVSDLDWIFANGHAVLESAAGATIKALAGCLGIDDLWGSRGEGIDWYMNARAVMLIAKPFLETGDKAGWLAYCRERAEVST